MSTSADLSIQLNRQSDSFYTQIVDYWREKISTGELKDGDALPSERELAEMFDVSRVPVREALKVLEYLGIVKQIKGKGVFVQKADPKEVLGVVGPMLAATTETINELFEIRMLIEPYAARQAAYNATEKELEILGKHIEQMQAKLIENEPVEETSFDFHTDIVNATGNQVMVMLTYFLSELQRQSRHKTQWNKARRVEAYEFHREIYEKIKARDGEGAYRIMEEHLALAKQSVIK